ncbi:hypothetical protein QTP88_005806 [Uroleucon formosanum]
MYLVNSLHMVVVKGFKPPNIFRLEKKNYHKLIKIKITACLEKPDLDSCMEVEYLNVNVNQNPEKPNLPTVLSSDKTMSLMKLDPKSCKELECLVDNMEEEPEGQNLPSFEKEFNASSCDETKYLNTNVRDVGKSNEIAVLSVPNQTELINIVNYNIQTVIK